MGGILLQHNQENQDSRNEWENQQCDLVAAFPTNFDVGLGIISGDGGGSSSSVVV
jgi:hypothetical protein